MPVNTLVTARAACFLCSVCHILTIGAWPNIGSGVVQPHAVAMIVSLAKRQSCTFSHNAMHKDQSVTISAHGIPSVAMSCRVFGSKPFPPREESVINRIDNGVFALCKPNPASTFFHVSSSAGRFCLTDEPACLFSFKQNTASQSMNHGQLFS